MTAQLNSAKGTRCMVVFKLIYYICTLRCIRDFLLEILPAETLCSSCNSEGIGKIKKNFLYFFIV